MGRQFLAFICVAALCVASTWADRAAYSQVVDLEAVGDGIVVHHHHDWTRNTWDARYEMITTNQNPFTADNEFAFVRIRSAVDDREIATVPSPALTWIGVTNEGAFVVGLSRIKIANPYQLVVLDREGRLLGRRHISSEVACLIPAEYERLKKRYPKEFNWLAEGVDTIDGTVYVDFQRMTSPRRLGRLWGKLLENACPSPFSPNISESVSNFVYWYHEESPDPEVELDDSNRPSAISLSDPTGTRVRIPI